MGTVRSTVPAQRRVDSVSSGTTKRRRSASPAYILAGIKRHSGAGEGKCVSDCRPRPTTLGRRRFDSGDAEIMKKRLSHYDARGRISMVDVSRKDVTERTATAHAYVAMTPEVI